MNAAELAALTGENRSLSTAEVLSRARLLSEEFGKHVFITMAERGMAGACGGKVEHTGAMPLRGEIDIVGAGDSVTANLTAALAAEAGMKEAMEIAQLASSIVIHQLGTTGTATVNAVAELLVNSPFLEE